MTKTKIYYPPIQKLSSDFKLWILCFILLFIIFFALYPSPYSAFGFAFILSFPAVWLINRIVSGRIGEGEK